jgi:NADH:ubiquinone oxidoreductase subunit 2 (subunit N)
MSYFAEWLSALESLGFLDVLLPFIIIFTIAFAVLQKSKILGKDSKNFNTMISLALALAAIIPHVTGKYPPGRDVVVIINTALPNVSLLMIAAMMVLLMMGVFGSEINLMGSPLEGLVVLFAVIAVGWTFLSASGVATDFGIDEQTRAMILAILAFGLIVFFITREENPEKEPTHKAIENLFGGWLGGKKH